MADQDFNSGFTGAQAVQGIQQSLDLLTAQVGETLYSTGNTGAAEFNLPIQNPPTSKGIIISPSTVFAENAIAHSTDLGTTTSHVGFLNPNGIVGQIRTSGSATTYETSSDPRLKNFLPDPTDDEIDDYFSRILDSAAVFTWKSDDNKVKTWGFNAHKAADNGLHMASEGEGPRELAIGEVYEEAVLNEKG